MGWLSAEYDVQVEAGPAVVARRDVAQRGQHLAVLVHRDAGIILALEAEDAVHRDREGAECA
ncbi:hypothetical protein KEU06_20390 [Pseudaminobacter sp. 19-2017]|uniref:Uncharacterized protein n=1 Tax=Pseudaminobacter soli (ex Zhang et al. 2022) TaxID=2831468 RepID=A0A942IAX2_9HYPH|nr:hypothetical protein [Pseudaminobacter soli]